tara:strand:- start:1167 stop:2051 length:885 start_codon:yes stop_codon:yes gene_type:complete
MSINTFFERKLFYVLGRYIWNLAGVSGFIALTIGFLYFIDSSIEREIKTKRNYFGKSYPVLKSKEDYFGKKRYPSIEKIEDYFGKKYIQIDTKKEYFGNKLLTDEKIKKIVIDSGKIKPYKKWLIENKNKGSKIGYLDYSNFLLTVPPNAQLSDLDKLYEVYKRDKYQNYIDKSFPKDLIEKQKEQNKIYKKYELSLLDKIRSQDKIYSNYLREITRKRESLNYEYDNYKIKIENQQSKLDKQYANYRSEIIAENNMKPFERITSSIIMGWGLGVIASSSVVSSILSIERNTRD